MPKRYRVASGAESEEEVEAEPVRQEGCCVYFYADVCKKSVLLLLEAINKANNCAFAQCTHVNECRVYLYIHSDGGDAYAGLSAMDHIRNNKVPITTIIDGFVASAATLLMLGGAHRVGYQHSTLLIHQLQTGVWGKHADLVDEAKNSTTLMNTIRSVYAQHTTLSDKKLTNLLNNEKNIGSDDCLKLGFVHELW
jgi:ATP-dependent protease ClpP protease subunit